MYRIPERELVYESCMSIDQAGEALTRIQQLDVYFDLFIRGRAYSLAARKDLLPRTTLPQSLKDYITGTREYVEDVLGMAEHMGAGIQKVTMNFYRNPEGDLQDREQVKKILSEYPELAVVSGGFDNLELTRADTNKGRTLRFMADLLGIPLEETMAVGDTENDLSIIRAAGLGVAMENAGRAVKENADVVTRSNDEGGVAYAIEQWAL